MWFSSRLRPRLIMGRIYTKHALSPLIASVKPRGISAVDGRTALGKAVKAWRQDQERHLGGRLTAPVVSILDHAETTKLLLASIDAFLLGDPSHLVSQKKRTLTPIALQRQALVESHRRDIVAIGLERPQAAMGEAEHQIIRAVRADLRRARRPRKPTARNGIPVGPQESTSMQESMRESAAPASAAPARQDGDGQG